VANYRTDFENIYNKDYYHGVGADPMVDYVYELNNASKTIRNYEWKGIFEVFSTLCPKGGRWLDFGCGGGGLVNYARERGIDAIGFDDGWVADMGRSSGTPILCSSELKDYADGFDFISAIEVLEHVPKPVDTLLQIRRLLKPGGILFITTGNAKPWRKKLLDWGYTKCPDVHISFYEPETLEKCLRMAGFQPKEALSFNGFVEIIKFKVLKAFRVKNMNIMIDMLPWNLVSRVVDSRHKVSKQPYGVAIGG
jgi:SAM-dependent methyltransferase